MVAAPAAPHSIAFARSSTRGIRRRPVWAVASAEGAISFGVPTVLRVGGYRFFFWSRENREPPHVHVDQAERYAKFWLTPVGLADARGFRSNELGDLRRLVEQHRTFFEEKWREHFRSQSRPGPA